MTKIIAGGRSGDVDHLVKAQYMATVSSVAVECGFPGLSHPQAFADDENFFEAFKRFDLAVQGEVARIRVRGRRASASLSVQLTGNTRTKIQHYVSRLRDVIENGDMPVAQTRILSTKLDELIHETESPRLRFGQAMLALSVIVAVVANFTTIAADGQAAVTQIMKLIGVDKQTEEEAISRLAPPPRALPAPSDSLTASRIETSPNWDMPAGSDLDDEIQF